MSDIEQGARSRVRRVTVDGVTCVEKRYNAHKDEPAVKLARERAFYAAYEGLDVLPRVIAWEDPGSGGESPQGRLVITYVEGERLIDRVQGDVAIDVPSISRSYGRAVAALLQQGGEGSLEGPSLAEVAQRVAVALPQDESYRRDEMRASADALHRVLEAPSPWDEPRIAKVDWSASNMLVAGGKVVCLYDFDTAYAGTRLSFLGDVLRSTMRHLDWVATRRGLQEGGVGMPPPDLLAAAAHLSLWQVALSSFHDGRFAWPPANEMATMLGRLTELAHA